MPKGQVHKCPNCGNIGECIITDEEKYPHACQGCGWEWIVRAGEIEVIG